MAIVAMKHLRLLGMESEREALLKAMQDMECVEISSIDGSEEALKSGFAKPDDKALMSAQEASRAYRTALASLDRFAPDKKGMFRKRQGVSRASFFDEENERQARAAAEALNADMRRLGEIESERTKNEALRASLTPWLAVDAPLDSTDGVLSLLFGTVGATVTDDALRALLAPVNRQISGGRFDVQAEESCFVEYGHDLVLPADLDDDRAAAVVLGALDLANAYIHMVYEAVAAVASGDNTPEAALEQLRSGE